MLRALQTVCMLSNKTLVCDSHLVRTIETERIRFKYVHILCLSDWIKEYSSWFDGQDMKHE